MVMRAVSQSIGKVQADVAATRKSQEAAEEGDFPSLPRP